MAQPDPTPGDLIDAGRFWDAGASSSDAGQTDDAGTVTDAGADATCFGAHFAPRDFIRNPGQTGTIDFEVSKLPGAPDDCLDDLSFTVTNAANLGSIGTNFQPADFIPKRNGNYLLMIDASDPSVPIGATTIDVDVTASGGNLPLVFPITIEDLKNPRYAVATEPLFEVNQVNFAEVELEIQRATGFNGVVTISDVLTQNVEVLFPNGRTTDADRLTIRVRKDRADHAANVGVSPVTLEAESQGINKLTHFVVKIVR